MPIHEVIDSNSAILVSDMFRLITPLVSTVIVLVIYAWNKMEKSIERLEKLIEVHATEDATIHDDLYAQLSGHDQKCHGINLMLNLLKREHEIQHGRRHEDHE